MPINPNSFKSLIQSQYAGSGFKGKFDSNLASAIGTAIANYLLTPNLVTCTLSGSSGITASISSTSTIVTDPNLMATLMNQRALGDNISGRDAFKFFSSVAKGISFNLQSSFLSGFAAGIGPGGGIGRFTNLNEQIISRLITALFTSKSITGRDANNLSKAIAFGFVNHLVTFVTIPVVCVGAVAPIPPAGPVPVAGIASLSTQLR